MKSEGQPTLARVAEQGMSDAGAMLAAGGTLQQTQTGYATAIQVQRPRELKQVQKAVLEEAELAGEDFFYAWTTKNKDGTRGLVEGISIEGAMIMARNWGNCAIPCRIEKDMPREWLMTGAFVDLETGFTVERPFRQRKSQATGKMDADRALDIALQIGVSKAQRNAIVQAMPKWLKGTALEKSKAAAEGKFKNVKKSNEQAMQIFGRLGVTKQQLEQKIGLPMDQWTPRDHVTLNAIYRAIRDRQTTVENEFNDGDPKAEPAPKSEPRQAAPSPTGGYGSDVPDAEFSDDDGRAPRERQPGEDDQ